MPSMACAKCSIRLLRLSLSVGVMKMFSMVQGSSVRCTARIEKNTASFPRYAVPRAVHLTLEPWTIENTFMTPTLTLKRNNLMLHFAHSTEGMYPKPAPSTR